MARLAVLALLLGLAAAATAQSGRMLLQTRPPEWKSGAAGCGKSELTLARKNLAQPAALQCCVRKPETN